MLFKQAASKVPGKEGALMFDDLLRIARLQEAVDCQLKLYGTDQVNNH